MTECEKEDFHRIWKMGETWYRNGKDAALFDAAHEMYQALEAICNDCDGSCVMNDYAKNCRGCTIPNLLKKARGDV